MQAGMPVHDTAPHSRGQGPLDRQREPARLRSPAGPKAGRYS
ncbi:MAG: hypothetical protein OXH92_15760 [Bryobacterales bacterium]|nr:hypothetical protein [Bryobacterales bacterium]